VRGRLENVHGVPQVDLSGIPDELPEGLVVLDVREDVEWQAGHIEGALHIPLMQVPERCYEVPTHRQVLVVCKVGSRSARATAYLQAQGVDAVNLAGGLAAWDAAGRPLVSETVSPPTVL
jgi:rhodanese-related sulfurtransferase